jgi:hypothetical protein
MLGVIREDDASIRFVPPGTAPIPDAFGCRGPAALASLPYDERKGWRLPRSAVVRLIDNALRDDMLSGKDGVENVCNA